MSESPSDAVLLSRVSVSYKGVRGARTTVLHDVTFSVPKGSFISVIGPSGSGKSTLLRTILGFLPITSGTLIRNFKRPAMVFQNYALFPWLTALQNVAFGPRMDGLRRHEREKLAREKLDEVGLLHHANHYPSELSGGERQRVSIARALAISPDFLVLDEPFSNLDTITAEGLKKDVLALWRNYSMTILMVNHLIPDAIELSDEVVVLAAGEVRSTLPINLTRPRDLREHHFFAHVDKLTEMLRSV